MPLTKQIIEDVVRREIKSALVPVGEKFNQVDERFNQVDEKFNLVDERFNKVDEKLDNLTKKVDKLTEIMTDVAGEFKKFDEEQTVLAGRQSDHSDRIEKLEEKVFSQPA